MIETTMSLAAMVASLVLVLSGTQRLANLSASDNEIRRQGVWPDRAVPIVSRGLTVLELVLGVVGVGLIVFAGRGRALLVLTLLTSATYAAFAVYASALRRWRPGAPCGCAASSLPVTNATVARSALLLGLALAGTGIDAPMVVGGVFETTVLALAGVTFALLVWQLPAALVSVRPETT